MVFIHRSYYVEKCDFLHCFEVFAIFLSNDCFVFALKIAPHYAKLYVSQRYKSFDGKITI